VNEKLDETNFLLYAARHYENPQCYDTIEFYDDLKRIKYIRRLFNIYQESGELKERLILNHIIILYNVFGVIPATRMLFFKLYEHKEQLKPFLVFLNFMPLSVINITLQGITLKSTDIISDPVIEEKLGRI
jgi:hypothetical protein